MPVTLNEIIDLFRREIPGWNHAQTVDTLKHGDPAAPFPGIACTFMATPAVIREAARRGARLIITHEPTYYNHHDIPADANDPVVAGKRALLEEYGITLWRCHDSIHAMRPDGILTGMVAALGWREYQNTPGGNIFDLPAQTLAELVGQVKRTLDIGMIRWVGEAGMPVRRVGLSVGCAGWEWQRQILRAPGVDVLLCGEQREWEACEYVRDSNQLGKPCGLIVLGHCKSEEAGVGYLASWLRTRLQGVEIHLIEAGDPFNYA